MASEMNSKIRTFIDAGVLINATRGGDLRAVHAAMIINDPHREYVSSIFVKLEVLPKAIYHKRSAEVAFYEAFFAAVTEWADPASIIEEALEEASRLGLAALDALHVTAAMKLGASELITTEVSTKPIHRARGVTVISI